MNIAIEISPLKKDRFLQHRVRGTVFYIENLRTSLLKYFPENKYIFFVRGENLPKNVDIVHYPYFEPFFLTMPIIKKVRTIVTVHDLTPLVFPEKFPSGFGGKLKWEIQKFALKNVDRIIADSFCSKKDIIKFAGIDENKIDVVYLAPAKDYKKIIIPKIDEIRLKKKYNLPDEFVLYVGDVTWNKNLPRLIEAVKMTNLNLVMVGKAITEVDFDKKNPWNHDRVIVQNLIKQNKNIVVLGFVPKKDLVSLYNMATIFAMPSLYEGFGLPLLEAMSCGCPVVTSQEGSIPEIVGEAAFYVDAYNKKSIAEGIKKIYEDNGFKMTLIEKGLKQARKFSWKETARQTINSYEKKD